MPALLPTGTGVTQRHDMYHTRQSGSLKVTNDAEQHLTASIVRIDAKLHEVAGNPSREDMVLSSLFENLRARCKHLMQIGSSRGASK